MEGKGKVEERRQEAWLGLAWLYLGLAVARARARIHGSTT